MHSFGPKLFCRSLTYVIGRMEVRPLEASFSLWARKLLCCRDLSVQNFTPNSNGYSCKMFPCISSALRFLCLGEHFKGDWLFGEWPSLRIFCRTSESLSLDRYEYVYPVESGYISGLIFSESIAALEILGNNKSPLSRVMLTVVSGFEFIVYYSQISYKNFPLE